MQVTPEPSSPSAAQDVGAEPLPSNTRTGESGQEDNPAAAGRQPTSEKYAVETAGKAAASAEEEDDTLVLQLNVKLSKGDTLKRKPSGSVWDQLNEQAPAAPMTLLNRMFTPLAESKWMEIVILLCIILNTGILAIQHPGNMKLLNGNYSQEFNNAMDTLDLVLTIIFTVEMFVRIFAAGFYSSGKKIINGVVVESNAYLTDSWNRLDFTVVLISWFSFVVEKAEIKLPIKVATLKALRILRVLKSLRYIKGIQVILVTLGKSAASMTTILGFLAFVFTIAGIVGIQMFRGNQMWRCAKEAPRPDATGFDWIPMGIGDYTYRTHCTPNVDPVTRRPTPLCPEYPPCNVQYDRAGDAIMAEIDNGVIGALAIFEGDDTPPIRGWLQRANYTGNGSVLGAQYSSEVVYVSSFSIETPSIAANTTNMTRCPPCYSSTACLVDEMCYEFGNPGFGHAGFDNIVMAWLTVFIEMANLYWWETGYRVADANEGVSAVSQMISWEFGFIIVLVLSMVSVNMFVAVICETFGEVRGEEGIKTFLGKKTQVKLMIATEAGEKELADITVMGHDDSEKVKERIGEFYIWPSGDAVKTYELELWYGNPKFPRKSNELGGDETVAQYLAIENNKMQAELEKQASAGKKMWEDPNPWWDTVYKGDDDDGNPIYQQEKVNIALHNPPPFYYTRWLAKMIAPETEAGGAFDNFVMSFILLNTITLATEHFGQPDDLTFVLDYCGHVFNLVFTGEMLAKIFGMGLSNYLAIPFNRLDFFIVLTSLMNYMGDILPGASVARLLRVFRLFRVARVVRILVKYESMRRLLNTVMGSGVALLNLTLFILFTVTIFAIFGMHLFGDWESVNPNVPIPRRNFQNFGRAWLMAFQTLTGDDWCNQMYQYMNLAGSSTINLLFAVLVYAMCFISTNYVLMNLFIAVILENFEIAENDKKDKQHAAELEWQRKKLEERIQQEDSRFVVEEPEEKKEQPVLNVVKPNGCADPCRNLILWGCRGFRRRDCRKKTRNIKKEEEDKPEDRSGFCCHHPKHFCAISGENDVALFCLRGDTAERVYQYEDEFGDTIEEKEIYYTQPIRKFFQAVERNAWFERTVMVAIMVSSILLAYEGPEHDPNGDGNTVKSLDGLEFVDGILITDILGILDTTFYGVFMFEFVTKLFGHGFYFTPDSYLADGWNRLDFVVVVFSTMNYIPGQGKSQLGRVFRLGRCLRPLRMVNKNPSLKVIVSAVIESLGTNLAVMGLAAMLFLIFGILGCNLFGGKFWHCTCGEAVGPAAWAQHFPEGFTVDELGNYIPTALVPTFIDETGLPKDGMNDRLLCMAATFYDEHLGEEMPCVWRNKPYSFDNIGEAIMGMFTAATLAGWTDIMEATLDTAGIDMQPQEMASPIAAVYWVLFVFLLAFFITNLFVGVLVDFIAQSDGSALQTEEQRKWTDLQRNIKELKPSAATPIPPKDPIRKWSLAVVTSSKWEGTSNICIIANVIVMCLEFQDQPIWYGEAMEIINNAFLIFFTIEMALKLIGMGPSRYWEDAWNKFDAIVVCSSWGGMVLNIQVQVVRAFRAFRIVLVLKNAAGLQALFKCLIWAILPSVNIGALLFLHFSLFAILGMQVFGDAGPHFDEVPRILPNSLANIGASRAYRLAEFTQTQQSVYTNFKTFFGTMKLLTECSSGKDWKIVMYEIYEVVPGFAFFYFFLHYFFSVYILCNLFVAVIIDQYGSSKRQLPVSRQNMEVFQNLWKAHLIHDKTTAEPSKDLFNTLQGRTNHTGSEYMIAGDDFANLRALLQNIGRMKGKTEETIRQEKVLARFKELEKTILICDFETAKQNLAALEEDKDVVKRLLSENITVWDILCRATDLDRGIEGLGEKEEDLNEWDSGILCPHPEPPPKTEEEIEAEKKMKIEQLTWDEWWERPDPNREGPDPKNPDAGRPKIGFLAELRVRIREHPYRETQSTTGCLCCKKTKPGAVGLKEFKPIAYNAVLEALILTNMGSGALSTEEKLIKDREDKEKEVEASYQAWSAVRQLSAMNKIRMAVRKKRASQMAMTVEVQATVVHTGAAAAAAAGP